ncbi:MAG: hypothetical protein QM628_04685 [Propionicimonas sp.]
MRFPLGIQAATAGFVLGRLLLNPPAAALVASLGDQAMRAAWPLTDRYSQLGLAMLIDGTGEPSALELEYRRLFVRHSPHRIELRTALTRPGVDAASTRAELRRIYRRDELSVAGIGPAHDDQVGTQVLYLADRLATAAHADLRGDSAGARQAADAGMWLRVTHLDPVVDDLLDAIEQRARTPLFQALPHLIRGFLQEHRLASEQLIRP